MAEELKIVERHLITDLEVRAGKSLPRDTVDLYVVGKNYENGKRIYAREPEFIEVEAGFEFPPFLYLPFRRNVVQILMDDLWDAGIRPTKGEASAGALSATERHLKDMQELVWKILPGILRGGNDE